MKKLSFEEIDAFVAKQPEVILCQLCGQELTDPKSRARKIGPICILKGESEASDDNPELEET